MFSSGGVIILFAVLRLTFTVPKNKQVNPKWLAVMSSTEALIALVVSCAPPFRKYFAVRGRSPSGSKYSTGAQSGAHLQSGSQKADQYSRKESASAGVEKASERDEDDELLGLPSKRNSRQSASQRDF